MRGAATIMMALLLSMGCSQTPSRLDQTAIVPVEVAELEAAPRALMPAALLPVPSGAPLGAVQTRDRVLRMHASPAGPRYVVTTRDGDVLDEGLDARALAARHPELAAALRRATAAAEPGAPFVDASLDLPSPAGPGEMP